MKKTNETLPISQTLEKKSGHGGKRAGAGRPRSVDSRNRIGLRVPDDIVKILDRQENRTAFIIEAIRAYDREQRKRTILGIEISYTKEA